jgi:hypothetical protein
LLAHEPLKGFARRLDARVHYAVLKIRTGKPGSLDASASRELRPVMSQRHAAASSGPNSVPGTLSVAYPRSVAPVKENVLTEQSQESEPNNQCSTRKHGRPVTHSVTRGAGAP